MNSIGSELEKGDYHAVKVISIVLAMIVYVMFLIFSGVHNYSLMLSGVRADLREIALVGVFALELSALAMPLALHFWIFDPTQRIVAYLFYGAEFLLIIFNMVLDFNINEQAALNETMKFYFTYVAPATPALPAIGWTILFILDPSFKARAISERVKVAALNTLGNRIIQATKEVNVNRMVEESAKTMAANLVAGILQENIARSGSRKLPKEVRDIIDAVAKDEKTTATTGNGTISLNADVPVETADPTPQRQNGHH